MSEGDTSISQLIAISNKTIDELKELIKITKLLIPEPLPIVRELVISSDELESMQWNKINLPYPLTKFKNVSVISLSVPKTYYNIPAPASLTTNGITNNIPAGIYSANSLMTYINTVFSTAIKFSASTLKYTFPTNTSTTNEYLSWLLGIDVNTITIGESLRAVNYQPFAQLLLLSNEVDTNDRIFLSFNADQIAYASVINYRPMSDKLLDGMPLISQNTETFSICLTDSQKNMIDLNGNTYSIVLKFYL
jgi:hypothetical protein